jgi:hypothetical protein
MGFFSWKCKCCDKSVVSPYSPKEIEWMNEMTMVLKTGEVVQGEYDGYGGLGNRSDKYADDYENEDLNQYMGPEQLVLHYEENATIYHTRCYEDEGEPGFTGPSKSASDQGFFLEEEEYASCTE